MGLMRCERKHGLSTEQFLVTACVGSSKNLKDLERDFVPGTRVRAEERLLWGCYGDAIPPGDIVPYPV